MIPLQPCQVRSQYSATCQLSKLHSITSVASVMAASVQGPTRQEFISSVQKLQELRASSKVLIISQLANLISERGLKAHHAHQMVIHQGGLDELRESRSRRSSLHQELSLRLGVNFKVHVKRQPSLLDHLQRSGSSRSQIGSSLTTPGSAVIIHQKISSSITTSCGSSSTHCRML